MMVGRHCALVLAALFLIALKALLDGFHLVMGPSASGAVLSKQAGDRMLLEQHVIAQRQFQEELRRNQNPDDCGKARILLKRPRDRDGFALEMREMARLLQVAVSTGRTLVISDEWRSAYAPPGCEWGEQETIHENDNNVTEQHPGGWYCLWEPVSKCTEQSIKGSSSESDLQLPSGSGIIPSKRESTYFNVKFYGPQRVLETTYRPWVDQTTLVDVIPHWERAFGRFWVRSQMAHFLWRPADGLQGQIDARMPPEIAALTESAETHEPFIAFHIRYTDNIKDLASHFGRNATVTRSFSRFMQQAESIRAEHPEIRNIYMATDNSDIIEECKNDKWAREGWNFLLQTKVERSNEMNRMWFKEGRSSAAGAIATDVEVMRRADFLVGSFQSNVYKLAVELNAAWHVNTYPMHLNRHRTVDVEWFEDP